MSAIREGDFLRGVFTFDSIQADFVWVRRGPATPPAYQTKALRLPPGPLALAPIVFVPQDTVARHPAVALVAAPAASRPPGSGPTSWPGKAL